MTTGYQLTAGTNVIRLADSATIPQPATLEIFVDGSQQSQQIWTPDWQAYQNWLSDGNTPLPAE